MKRRVYILFPAEDPQSQDAMEAMAALPRFVIYKPALELIAKRKYPPRDEETDVDW